MTRRSKSERRQLVLEEASRRAFETALDWAASITFLELATETGIDQAQIARDFGSKQNLRSALIHHMFNRERYAHFTRRFDEVVDEHASFDSVWDVISVWATGIDATNWSDDGLRSEMLFWAVGELGSEEWEVLAKFHEDLLDAGEAAVEAICDTAVRSGASKRDGLTYREWALLTSCIAEGLAIRRRLSPDLVPEGITARAGAALAAALFGTTNASPVDEMRNLAL